MKLTVAGGCGEHGRNCFLVESGQHMFLVDCGLMPGASDPYPHLSDVQIQAVDWLFLTHSHLDHTGAYPWLVKHGFSGYVVTTRETIGQLQLSPERVCLIDDLTPTMSAVTLTDGLSVRWGKSGHCAGSVWYDICMGDENILFSGDYIEDTLVYNCDLIRGVKADSALLDSAYGDAKQTPADYRIILVSIVKDFVEQGRTILFPVPKYGRGLELLLLLHRHFPKVHIALDDYLRNELSRIKEYEDWVKPEALVEIQNIPQNGGNIPFCKNGFVFVCDPQLKSPKWQNQAEEMAYGNDKIIITGNVDMGSFSENLLASGRAVFSRYAAHLSNDDRMELEAVNCFKGVVPFHSSLLS